MRHDVLVDLTPLDTWSRFTGTGRYIRELALALEQLSERERHGLTIGGLTALWSKAPVGPLTWCGGEQPRVQSRQEAAWLNQRRTLLTLTLARLRPRLFHAPYHLGTPRGGFVPRVVTCLDLVPHVLHQDYLPGRPFYRRALWVADALRFHSARRVIAISQHTADDLVRVLGVPADKIDVALLGVNLTRYRLLSDAEQSQVDEVLGRHGLTKNSYVFYMGRADPRKNVDVLVAAFAQAKVDGLELVIIGNMRPSDQVAFDVAQRAAGSPPGVRFLGFVDEDDLPAIIGSALAFVFCSTYEGYGNVPVEAMACGCPVICTGATSIGETVGDASLLVPARDVSATAAAIARVAKDSSLRRQLRDAGLRRAAQFTWRNTALATMDSYARALGC